MFCIKLECSFFFICNIIFRNKSHNILCKVNTIIKCMFEYKMKHHEFEERYNENSDIRASRLDNVVK